MFVSIYPDPGHDFGDLRLRFDYIKQGTVQEIFTNFEIGLF